MLELNKLYNMDCMQGMREPGQIVLDTHGGSCSSLNACHDMHFPFVGFELDPDYYKAAQDRMQNHFAQLTFF